MKLKTYKAEDGLFICIKGQYKNSFVGDRSYEINNKKCELTWSDAWVFLAEEDKIETIITERNTVGGVLGYSLLDESFESDKIPKYLSSEEVARYSDEEDEEYYWKNYEPIRGLYKEVRAEAKVVKVDVEFTEESLGSLKITNKDAPEKMLVKIKGGMGTYAKVIEVDLSSCVIYDDLIKMLVPDLLHHKHPCSISSAQAYSIVRNHIKENIDKKVARITSDYDFCFTVQKLITIKPYIQTTEEKKKNGKSYATPKITRRTIEHKQMSWFEMTDKEHSYKGYSIIDGFKGTSLEDLIENVKQYLEELMDSINEPLKECECCSGTGIVKEKKFDMNKRG